MLIWSLEGCCKDSSWALYVQKTYQCKNVFPLFYCPCSYLLQKEYSHTLKKSFDYNLIDLEQYYYNRYYYSNSCSGNTFWHIHYFSTIYKQYTKRTITCNCRKCKQKCGIKGLSKIRFDES